MVKLEKRFHQSCPEVKRSGALPQRATVGIGCTLTGNIPNGTTDYIYMGNQVVEESSTNNTPIRQYVWGTYIDECIQLTTLIPLGPKNLSPGTYYLLQDLLYRTVALTNATGGIVETYDTDAYGNTLIFTGPGPDGVWFTDDDVQSFYGANDVIYCGYRYDPEAELYYVRNRSYNAVLGRWLQRDPIGYAGGINLYEYVHGNPVLFVDPNGTSIKNCPRDERRPRPGYKAMYNGCGNKQTRWWTPQYSLLWAGYFTPACNNHDICYGTCNSFMQDCDLILEDQLRVACLEWWNSLGWNKLNPWAWALLDVCYAEAKLFWEAVNLGGQSSYDSAQDQACICCTS